MIRKWAMLWCCVLSLNGCFLAPAIDSFKKLGVTSSDREALFPEHMKRFNEALYWGYPQEALKYVVAESRAQVSEQLKDTGESERTVETKIRSVDFAKDSYEAKVEVDVRYFKVPVYVVNTRHEKQDWVFSTSDGWKLKNREVVKAS